MTLTLQRIAETAKGNGPLFFVMATNSGTWSTTATINGCFHNLQAAEACATALKRSNPNYLVGVAELRSFAQHVENPVEIIRVAE